MARIATFFLPYLDRYRSDRDDLGTVEKLPTAAFQRYQDRRDPNDIGRDTAENSSQPVPLFYGRDSKDREERHTKGRCMVLLYFDEFDELMS